MTQKKRNIPISYQGLVVNVDSTEIELPNGQCGTFEIVHHPGGAAVVAIDAEQRVCLLRQYRVIAQDWIWELPAGKLEPSEAPLRTAQRELEEEAGVLAEDWQVLAAIYSSPGVFDEIIHLYLARGLRQVATAHEAEELIEVHWIPLSEVRLWIGEGRIRDGKTLSGLCLTMLRTDPDHFKSGVSLAG